MLHPGVCLLFCRSPQDLPGQGQPNFLPVRFLWPPPGAEELRYRFQLARLVGLLVWRGVSTQGSGIWPG